ncbi:MAG: TlpA family protein disulfide reductase, partial [Treponema sp.]|nr:TlpA family protein disulfide reductase [Treponema sp.]
FIDMEDTSLPVVSALPSSVPAFKSFDVYGNEVTRELFSRADLTVMNVWGTFCGPCISEMPDMEEWNGQLPDGVQIVGLVCDVNSLDDADGLSSAKTILDKAGVSFVNVLASDDLQIFLSSIQFVPTTFLVDRSGSVVSEPIVGASIVKYKKAVNDYLSRR